MYTASESAMEDRRGVPMTRAMYPSCGMTFLGANRGIYCKDYYNVFDDIIMGFVF